MVFVFVLRDTMEKLHSMDDAFKKQIQAIVEAHQAEILQLANEKQKYIDCANSKVPYVKFTLIISIKLLQLNKLDLWEL